MTFRNWSAHVFLMELRSLIAYRADFWINFIGRTFFSLVVAYYLWAAVFSYTDSEVMKGFTISGMIFYYLIVPLIFRIQQGQGIGFLSREIYDGSLNKYLLYPISLYHYKMMTYLANSLFFLLQLFLILFIYNILFYNPEIFYFSFINIIAFLCILAVVSVTFFYLFTIVELLAFWYDSIWSLGVILRFGSSFLGGALIPLSFFPEWARYLISFTPFPYLIDFPMRSLQGALSVSEFFTKILITICWLLFFRFVSRRIWEKGKYVYTGVGI